MRACLTPCLVVCVLLGVLTGSPGVQAANETDVWLIGGGNVIENSQGQIEQNVIWLESLLQERVNKVNTFYSAGTSDHVLDVVYWSPKQSTEGVLQPLARVFTAPGINSKRYKRHSLKHVRGGTDKQSLLQNLSADFASLARDREVLLVYNGHGGLDESDVRKNYLKLWGDESLTVQELDALLDRAPTDTTIRFIMTQCFSGAFYNLIFESPESKTLSPQLRCGFMAESAFREAEGCDLGINSQEFRDYTTFFFAALSGLTRLGTPLAFDPDSNQDGKVSFREAHLFTLRNAHSRDLSRSTSESYLEAWQPWYLRWDSRPQNTESEYWKIAAEIARRNGWTLDASLLRASQRALTEDMAAKTIEIENTLQESVLLQKNIQQHLLLKWPELFNPYTEEYHRVLDADLNDILSAITAHADYARLTKMQEMYLAKQQELLSLKRDFTQLEKIFRLKKLSVLESQFSHFASSEQLAEFQRIRTCEEGFLD